MSMNIELSVSGQRLRREMGPGIVGGSRYYLTAHVAFAGTDWDGAQVWLRIDQDGAQNAYLLDADGCVTADRGINLPAGKYTMSLMGMRDNMRITTNEVPLSVMRSGADGGDPLPEIQQTAAEQIALLAQEAVDTASALRADADAGLFDGEDAKHQWDGSVLTITSASGTSSADLRGPQGPEGKQGPQGQAGKDAPQDAVRYGVQALDEAQQETARGNIGAASEEALSHVKGDLASETARAKEAEDNRMKKFYTGNMGAVSVADSDDGAVRNLVIGGRCEQTTTNGYNLLPNHAVDSVINGVTFKVNPDGSITANGTATNFADQYLYGQNADNGEYITLEKGDYAIHASLSPKDFDTYIVFFRTVEFSAITALSATTRLRESDLHIYGVFYRIVIDATAENLTIYPMIERGTIAHDYEPYTGGSPSPSSDYPQEIKCVEGCTMTVTSADGTKAQEAAIPVTLRGIGDVRDELYVYADGSGKLIQRIGTGGINDIQGNYNNSYDYFIVKSKTLPDNIMLMDKLIKKESFGDLKNNRIGFAYSGGALTYAIDLNNGIMETNAYKQAIIDLGLQYLYIFDTTAETPLTAEQVKALYDLRTHYGGTNITYASDNGVEPVVNFDYACAIENFVEYIKAQQGDTRGMIYDMDDRLTQAEVTALEAAIDAQIAQAMMEV